MKVDYGFIAACCLAVTLDTVADCKQLAITNQVDHELLWTNFTTLSSDDMQGRKPGTPGHERAKRYIQQAYERAGLLWFHPDFLQPFKYRGVTGENIVAYIPGKTDNVIVITAHYDHLGKFGPRVFNGADDNASGVAAMLELGRQMTLNQPLHTIVLVATDQEEKGLYGARAFLDQPPVALDKIKLNINLDMIAQDRHKRRLFLAGAKRHPHLKPIVEAGLDQATVCLREGHEGRSWNYDRSMKIDWDDASDHAPFMRAGIPYLFFSVNDHKYYHSIRDTAKTIDPLFYQNATYTILNVLKAADRQLSLQE